MNDPGSKKMRHLGIAAGVLLAGKGLHMLWRRYQGRNAHSNWPPLRARMKDKFIERNHDQVHEASEESFPASDAPSFSPGTV